MDKNEINVDARKMREVANIIQKEVPGMGFVLLVFNFNEPGISNYISNGKRSTMIKALEESVIKLKAGVDFPTPEAN
jgi:hypothetical protein